MASLFYHGFERLSSTYLTSTGNPIWDIEQFSAATGSVTTSVPRSGGSQQCLTSSGNADTATRSLGGNFSHLFGGLGWMYRAAALPATPTNCDFVFFDGATAQVGWVISVDGEIIVYAGATTAATELGRSATGVIVAAGTSGTGADYKMIEIDVVFHGSVGTVKVNVADVEVLNLTNKNTAPSGNAQASRFRIANRASSAFRMDDIYVNDDTGSAPENGFMGEAFVVESIIPTGNGNSSQWLGSDGNSIDNYLLVDDTGNDDTDYIKSSTVNDIDLHTLGNLSNASGTVIGANHYFIAKKDDVVTRKVSDAIRINSVNYVGSEKTMTGSYVLLNENRLLNPDTSARFTIAEINALESGVKLTT